MSIKFTLIAICSSFIISLTAQNEIRCYSTQMMEQKIQENPDLAEKMRQLEEQTQLQMQLGEYTANKTAAVITIPVVIHVLYYTTAQNISATQIQNQINVLNKDYRKLNTDTTKIPAAFKTFAADCEIQFCLAQRTPLNQPTNGIERKQVFVQNIGSTSNYYDASQGGLDAWDPDKYLNIWVCMIGNGVLGFAYYPGMTVLDDGVVIDYRYFGTGGTATSPYNLGRTASHEIGHYLNLKHIWGDDGGTCTGSDGVADTPNQADATPGSPTFPKTDACSPTSPGIMFMNFMDYSYDNALVMFTKNQKTRMVNTLNGLRSLLKTSNGCISLTGIEMENYFSSTIKVYPNPADGYFIIEKNVSTLKIESVGIYSVIGNLVAEQALEDNFNEDFQIDISAIPQGNYIVKVKSSLGVINKKLQIIK